MIIVDIIAGVLILLGALYGFKNGGIKTLVKLIGLVAITIVSFQFKSYLSEFLMRHLPFFNFIGEYDGLYALNFLLYEGSSFLFIFIILYCLLNVLVEVSGLIELLVKVTVVLEPVSKLVGTILGAIEGVFFVFVAGFFLLNIGATQQFVIESKVVNTIVYKTPIVNEVFGNYLAAGKDIYDGIQEAKNNEDKTEANLNIIRVLRLHSVVNNELVNEMLNNGKLHMNNVVVVS